MLKKNSFHMKSKMSICCVAEISFEVSVLTSSLRPVCPVHKELYNIHECECVS